MTVVLEVAAKMAGSKMWE